MITNLRGKRGKVVDFNIDEHARPKTTMESLGNLPSVFKKDGTVTAGNASGIVDGAAAIVLATEKSVKENNLTPLARLAAFSYVGCDPKIMGEGPVHAINEIYKIAGVQKNDIGIFDINEAFATQWEACRQQLDIDPEIINICGGAIALGHPLGASGTRITMNLAYSLQRENKKYAIGSACIGGGQGIAVLLEKC